MPRKERQTETVESCGYSMSAIFISGMFVSVKGFTKKKICGSKKNDLNLESYK